MRTLRWLLAVGLLTSCAPQSRLTPPASPGEQPTWTWLGGFDGTHQEQAYVALLDYCDGKGLPWVAELTRPANCALILPTGGGGGSVEPTDQVAGLRNDLARERELEHNVELQAALRRATWKVLGRH
jgi:hypothetical protein